MPSELIIDSIAASELRLNLRRMPSQAWSNQEIRIKICDERIMITKGNQELWIEVNDRDNLAVHAYDALHDEPTSIECTADRLTVTGREEDEKQKWERRDKAPTWRP